MRTSVITESIVTSDKDGWWVVLYRRGSGVWCRGPFKTAKGAEAAARNERMREFKAHLAEAAARNERMREFKAHLAEALRD